MMLVLENILNYKKKWKTTTLVLLVSTATITDMST